MAHLTLVTTKPQSHPKTDTRLLKLCARYLQLLGHQRELREKHRKALALAEKILRDKPADTEAADLWRKCWHTTPAHHLGCGVESNERKLAELIDEITTTPAQTEAGVRARLHVWRTILGADDADRLLDSIAADFRRRRRA